MRREVLVVIARWVVAMIFVLMVSACGDEGPSSSSAESTTPVNGPSVESLYSIGPDGEVTWAVSAGDINARVAVADEAAIVASGIQESESWLQAFELGSGDIRWKVELGEGTFPGQLMIAGDVVVVLIDGRSGLAFEAFDPATGGSLWRRDLSGRSSAGAVEEGGLLVFADSGTDQVVALDPATGEERWTRVVDGASGKATVLGGRRVLVDSFTELHALEAGSGEVAWSVPTTGDVDSMVALGDAVGAITFGQGSPPDMALEVFDGRSGSRLWSFVDPNISVPPSVAETPGGVLVQRAPDPSTGDTVVMLDAVTGEPIWSAAPAGGAFGPTVVLASGDVLVAASDESGQTLTDTTATLLSGETGEVVWAVEVPGTVLVPPTATATSLLLPAETDDGSAGALVALDPTSGGQLWSVEMALPPLRSPTTVGDTVLVGSARRFDLGG